MTKRERVLAAIEGRETDRPPFSFSLHFPPAEAFGGKGVASHLRFYEETDLDILKIMNESLVEPQAIAAPADWAKVPLYTAESPLLAGQLAMAKGILESCGPADFTLGTVHGICASAIHPLEAALGYDETRKTILAHLREDEAPLLEAFARITESMVNLIEGYAALGVDAIYYAALGGESRYFTAEEFDRWIKPFDLEILAAAKAAGLYTFLHICKDGLDMERYRGYAAFSDVVNWGVYEAPYSIEAGRRLFPGCAVMGGLSNLPGSPLVAGDTEALRGEIARVNALLGGRGYIVGADCTLPANTPYSSIRAATRAV